MGPFPLPQAGEGLVITPSPSGESYTENELPQPQDDVAFGLCTLK